MMAFSQTLEELASALQIPALDILLRCIFCDVFMTREQRKNFHAKRLYVSCRESGFYGICPVCAKAVADYERVAYPGIVLEYDGVVSLEGKPLCDIKCLCLGCLAILTYDEKVFCALTRLPFTKIRLYWRNYCSRCLL